MNMSLKATLLWELLADEKLEVEFQRRLIKLRMMIT